jgi:hypothetical protein
MVFDWDHPMETTLEQTEEYPAFRKIPRLNRRVVVTEKIDGTNALIAISDDGKIRAGSRSRWITPEHDNFGFAGWVKQHKDELYQLGPGLHFGEWWGEGIQRRYGLSEKRFSLFNTTRWTQETRPACCHVVPVLYDGPFMDIRLTRIIDTLKEHGSQAAPGFDWPEGIVVWHETSGATMKYTFDKNDEPKGNP